MRNYFLIPLAILFSQSSQAELTLPELHTKPLEPPTISDHTLARAGLTINEDDITASQDLNKLVLNEQQRHEAEVWGLSVEEEKRYVVLMQNRSKLYYQGLRQTPIDILGLNARSEAERNHFAELAAKQEAQKVAKNIAWNNAFYKAYNKLFAKVPVVGEFDPSPYSPYAHAPLSLQSGETLYLFIKETDAVKTILFLLTEALEKTPDTHLHLMLVGMDNLAIQLWANKEQIPQRLVHSGRITLNQGDLHYQALKIDKKHSPLLLLSKNGSASLVDLGKF